MNYNSEDNLARNQALHPGQSFIIQAPAGSGKTSLLTFRFLTLLSKASNYPEESLAITFTKKAAAEMRERIISALILASQNKPAESEHEKQLIEIAGQVLKKNKQLKWRLLENPMRLKIMTVDAFCASITQQMPLSSGIVNDVTEDARYLYEKAAYEMLQASEENEKWYDDLYVILKHLDNQVDYVKQLFADLLAKREQWLPYVLNDSLEQFKEYLENSMSSVVDNVLENIPLSYKELPSLATFAGSHSEDFRVLESLNHNWPKDLSSWKALANLCLTKEGKLRKSVTKRQGFTPKFPEQKKQMQDLLATLDEHFIEHLKHVQLLPEPKYNKEQWEFLRSLINVLPVLSAKLNLIFKKYKKTDFASISIAANYTLGQIDNPTDLMLGLDGKLKHILVDEFQDTSVSQLKLLEKIVQTWSNNDGRTLFLVGDPMQSIYRFRQAEVNVFFQVQKYGIGNLKLQPLILRKNFRSSETIVDWVNENFRKLFNKGIIQYTESCAVKPKAKEDNVFTNLVATPEDEVEYVIKVLKTLKTQTAILVRSRNHLEKLIPALVQHDIKFQGQEIEPLADRPIIRDLLALTQSILHLGDKLSWFSLLRSPWIGLELVDIYEISKQAKGNVIWSVLVLYESLPLREVAKQRLKYPVWILQQALELKSRKKLKNLIYDIWQAFGGEYVVLSHKCIKDANDFFSILEENATYQAVYDISYLPKKISKLYSKSDKYDKNAVQIMTVHKSKGLEFDNVILLGLGRKMVTDSAQLFLWKEFVVKNKSRLVFAPVKSHEQDQDELYNYLRQLEKEEYKQEQIRLLYVAATRAKKRLYWVSTVNDKNEPVAGSLLHLIWPSMQEKFAENLITFESKQYEVKQKLHRVPLDWQEKHIENMPNLMPIGDLGIIAKSNTIESRDFDINWFSKLGTILHQFLFLLLKEDKQSFLQLINDKECLTQLLRKSDIGEYDMEFAIQVIQTSIQNIVNDKVGKWILKNHRISEAEWRITHYFNGKTNDFILDRCFVDNGVRWIIDYKLHFTKKLNLENVISLHKWQLFKYAKVVQDLDDTYPIKVGVYFPYQNIWHEYDFVLEKTKSYV